jgi:hypothetical protein
MRESIRPVAGAIAPLALQPFGTAIVVVGQSADNGSSAVDHLPPKIVIGAPANAAEAGLAACRVVTGHKTYPCRELPARPEMPAIINRGDERCRDHRANARQFGEPAASFVSPANSEELPIELLQPAIKAAKLVEHIGEHRAREI